MDPSSVLATNALLPALTTSCANLHMNAEAGHALQESLLQHS